MKSFWQSAFGASCLMIQPLLLNLLSLPVTAYIIAVLGPHDYGQWAVALTLIATVTILTNLGLRSYFIRAVAQDPSCERDAFAEQLGARVMLAAGAGVAAVLAAAALRYPALVLQCTAILAAGVVFTTAGAVVSDLLQARQQLPLLATINMVAGLLLTAASFLAMWYRTGPLGLAVSYMVGPITTGVLSLWVVHRRIFPVQAHWQVRRLWVLLKQARVLGLQQFVWTLGNQAENLLVPKLLGLSTYGYFAAGTLLPRRMEVLPDALTTAFYPVMARAHSTSGEQARAVMTRFGLLLIGLCVPAAVTLFLLADPIARLLFPENPEVCRRVMQITVWWVPLLGIAHGMGYALNAAGREVDEARLSIVATLSAMVASVVLVLGWGLIGACVALVARGVLAIIVRLPYFLRSIASRDERHIVAEPAAVR